MSRRLHASPEVANVIPASYIAHMESQVDDDNNVCGVCRNFIATPVINLYAVRDSTGDGFVDVRMAHPGCHNSTVDSEPGLANAKRRHLLQKAAEGGFDLNMVFVVRPTGTPRAVLLQEFRWLAGHAEVDPLQTYADGFGLSPISGDLTTITAAPTSKIYLRPVRDDGLELVHGDGIDRIDAYPDWRDVALADRQAAEHGGGVRLDRAGEPAARPRC